MKQLVVCFLLLTLTYFCIQAQSDYMLLAPVKENGLWGYIDKEGNYIILPKFEFADDFSEGLAAVKIEGLWGYIKGSGESVMTPQFDIAHSFVHGLARVANNGEWSYIDKEGQYLNKATFELANDFVGERALVKQNGKYGFIDRTGAFVGEPKFDDAFDFDEEIGRASVKMGKQWHYCSDNGELLEASFDAPPAHFSENVALVNAQKQFGFINKNGDYVITPQFTDAGHFSQGLATVRKKQDDLFGYINQKGQYAIVPQFIDARHFTEGLAAVRDKRSGGYGYIDLQGNMVIATQFTEAQAFRNGIAKVSIEDRFGFIDTYGNFIAIPEYNWAFDFSHGLAAVSANGLFGYINPLGKQVILPRFEGAGNFQFAQIDNMPLVTMNRSLRERTTEKRISLKFNIRSATPLINYLVFVNNQLHSEQIGHKGTHVKPIKEQNNDPFVKQITTVIDLEEGFNEIYVKAMNNNGTTDSEVLTIQYVMPNSIEKPNLYVLSIGIADYKESQYNLNFADDDAIDFSKVFEEQKEVPFKERLFDKIDIQTLINKEATASNIRRTILALKGKVNKGDVFILHISSHGEIDDNNGFHIRTYDTDAEYLDASLRNQWLAQQIRNFEGSVVQFIDACHSGSGGEDLVMQKGAQRATDIAVRELKDALKSKGIYFFASSSSHQTSQEQKRWKNGAFTEALLDCFKQKEHRTIDHRRILADTNGDGFINTNELSTYLSKVVKQFTKGQQSPKVSIENGEPINIFVVKQKKKE